jgi:hypothetical protein
LKAQSCQRRGCDSLGLKKLRVAFQNCFLKRGSEISNRVKNACKDKSYKELMSLGNKKAEIKDI